MSTSDCQTVAQKRRIIERKLGLFPAHAKAAATRNMLINNKLPSLSPECVTKRSPTLPPPKPMRTFAQDEYDSPKLSHAVENYSADAMTSSLEKPEPSEPRETPRRPKYFQLSHEYEQIFSIPSASPQVFTVRSRSFENLYAVPFKQPDQIFSSASFKPVCPPSLHYSSRLVPGKMSGPKQKAQNAVESARAKQRHSKRLFLSSRLSKANEEKENFINVKPNNFQHHTSLDDTFYSEIAGDPKSLSLAAADFSIDSIQNEVDHEQNDNDSAISSETDLSEIRTNRAKTVRRQTLIHYDQQETAFMCRKSSQLFELAALIDLQPNDSSNPLCVGKFSPFINYKYPDKPVAFDPAVLLSLPFLCYPDLNRARPHSPLNFHDETFVLILTDRSADRKFAYCCRFVPFLRSSHFLDAVHVVDNHEDDVVLPSLPQILCLVTPLQAVQFYTDLVRECACWLKDHYNLRALDDFFAKIFKKHLPASGRKLFIDVPLTFQTKKRLQITNRISARRCNGLRYLLERLNVENTLILFASLLSERRVLIIGDNVSSVSKIVQAAVAMLDPFEWPHTLIPLIPDSYIQLCFSPTPYLIGVLRCNLHELKHLLVCDDQAENEEYILIYDMDYGIIKERDYNGRSMCGSGLPSTDSSYRFLPSRVARTLKHSLRSAFSNKSDQLPYNHDFESKKGSCNENSVVASKTACRFVLASDATVADSFLNCFVQLLGHYRDFIVQQQDGRYTFQKEQFIRSGQRGAAITKSHKTFLKWFVETGMFQVWMRKKLEALNVLMCNSELGQVNRDLPQNHCWDALDIKIQETRFSDASKNRSNFKSKRDLIALVSRTCASLFKSN